jgi:hypothetical protein
MNQKSYEKRDKVPNATVFGRGHKPLREKGLSGRAGWLGRKDALIKYLILHINIKTLRFTILTTGHYIES